MENALWIGGLGGWGRGQNWRHVAVIHVRGAGGLDQGDVEGVIRNGRILDKL